MMGRNNEFRKGGEKEKHEKKKKKKGKQEVGWNDVSKPHWTL